MPKTAKTTKIVSLAKTVNFPYMEWRGCLANDNYFIIRYEDKCIYFAAAPRELSASLNLKGWNYDGYPRIDDILKYLDLEPPDDWIDLSD